MRDVIFWYAMIGICCFWWVRVGSHFKTLTNATYLAMLILYALFWPLLMWDGFTEALGIHFGGRDGKG